MAIKGLFENNRTILTTKNCLIHKPLCERCKKNKNLWKIAKQVFSFNNKFYSLCNECYEEISNDSDQKRNAG